MKTPMLLAALAALLAAPPAARAAPAPREFDWIAADFRFHDGTLARALKLHYTTLGDPSSEPVLVLHGTAQSGAAMLGPTFAGELFGPGQPLDAATHFIILPDALGAGKSAKPSDGERADFPHYDYDDMVRAQYRLVTEALGLRHLRLVLGNSMGGMHAWMWAEMYPDFVDAVVPMASQPTQTASRNWMMRRLLIEGIRQDPEFQGGRYTTQPRSLRMVNAMFGVATSGGTLGWQAVAPTHAQADAVVEAQLAAPITADANDFVLQWDASRDYDAAPGLERITAPLLAINAADDERNPPETGIMEREMRRVRQGRLYLIPASAETRGHGTTSMARFWKGELESFMQSVPRRGM